MASNFRFDPDSHTYWYGDRRVTGITEAMQRTGLSPRLPDNKAFKTNFEYAGKRGGVVHRMLELHNLGRAHEFEMDDSLKGYLEAARAFSEEYGYRPDLIETPLGHDVYMFGGTPDSAGPCAWKNSYAIVEYKTRDLKDHDGFQLAGQELLVNRDGKVLNIPLLAVRLLEDGRYKVRDFTASKVGLRRLFLSAVAISNWQISQEGV